MNPKTIDLTYLIDASAGNMAFIKEMIQIFLRQTPVFLAQLKDLVEQGDRTEFRALLHKFKPTVAMLGISEGTSIIKEIENIVKSDDNLEKVKDKLFKLEKLCEIAYSEIKREISLLE